jgi:ATP-dependent RNA helicase DDX49/DBP8
MTNHLLQVLDEADRLLTATFGPELSYLFSILPPARSRQTLLFTATLTEEIEALANKEPKEGEKKPILCQIEQSTSTPATLDQRYLFVPSHVKEPYLFHLLTNPPIETKRQTGHEEDDEEIDSEGENDIMDKVPLTIIFVAKSQTAALLSQMLLELGIDNVTLHSNLTQPQRMNSLSTFRSQSVPVLITTDLGSRGLDVPDVEMVVNWELPRDWRDYIHRVGRTARNGKKGLAVNFVSERDIELFKGIEDVIQVKMQEVKMHEETVLEALNEVMTAKRMATMHLHDTHFGQRKQRNEAKAALRMGQQKQHKSKSSDKKNGKSFRKM